MNVQLNIPPIVVAEQTIVAQNPILILEEEFEEISKITKAGIDFALTDETVGLKKTASEKSDQEIHEYIPKLLDPVKQRVTQTFPYVAPCINRSLDTSIEPTAKKIAKYSTETSIDKCMQPSLHKSTDIVVKGTHKSVNSAYVSTKKSTSFIW